MGYCRRPAWLVARIRTRYIKHVLQIINPFIYCLVNGGIIYYERYGGDPKKRSLHNKLIVMIAFSLIIHGYTVSVGMAWRIQIGQLNEEIAMTIHFIRDFLKNF